MASEIMLQAESLEDGPLHNVEIFFEEDSRMTSSGEAAFAKMKLLNGEEAVAYVELGDVDPILQGTKAVVSGTWKSPDWSRDEYLWQNGAVGRIRISELQELQDTSILGSLRQFRRAAIDSLGDSDDGRALLQAIVCGYRHSIASTAIYARFQKCGLAHLVAVSGAHLVIVIGLFVVALKSAHVSKRLNTALLVIVMSAYLVFSGFPVSAIRATVMTSIGMSSIYGKRRPSSLNALGIGIFAIILTSPCSAVSVSFALSALSTAGIILFAPLFGFWFSALPITRFRVIGDALSMTCAASLLSQLYACSVFHVVPIIGPLSNIVCAPMFPVVCAMGLIAAFSGSMGLPIASAIIDLASAISTMFGKIVCVLASVPYSSIPCSIEMLPALVVTAFVAAILWFLWPSAHIRHVGIALAIAFPLLVGTSFVAAQQDAIIMLDVGQGDSFLVKSRGSTLLVDTGNHDSQLIGQLATASVFSLDSVLVTHSDDDHMGSLDALERSVHVDRVIIMKGLQESEDEKNVHLIKQARRTANKVSFVSAGDAFNVGAFNAKVIWPYEMRDDGGNADSICLLLEYDGDDDGVVDFKAFFTGDAEEAQIESILNTSIIGDIDVLKVGHHGSKGGMNMSQLSALKPEIALIGVGAGNRYGHPSEETLDMLYSVGCKIFRSDLDGQVALSFSANEIRVRLQ